jgi:hypothetical protein
VRPSEHQAVRLTTAMQGMSLTTIEIRSLDRIETIIHYNT